MSLGVARVLLGVLGAVGLAAVAFYTRIGSILLWVAFGAGVSWRGTIEVGNLLIIAVPMMGALALFYYGNRAAFRRLTERHFGQALAWSGAVNLLLAGPVLYEFVTYKGNDRGLLFPFGL